MSEEAPPPAPASATNTSIVPCVRARFSGTVSSTTSAVPDINPRFQPVPSRARTMISQPMSSLSERYAACGMSCVVAVTARLIGFENAPAP